MRTVASAMRGALEDGDVKSIAAALGPDVKSRQDALKIMHLARTKATSVPLAKRQYSHQWLEAHGLPSLLPKKDHPPVIVRAVGIAVGSQVPFVQKSLSRAMEEACKSVQADGEKDDNVVRRVILEARDRELRGLELKLGERAK